MKIRQVRQNDRQGIYDLLIATGNFLPSEIDVAMEIFDEAMVRPESDYYLLAVERNGQVVGFACYGPVPLTRGSWDLYWLAVHPASGRKGVGRLLVQTLEQDIIARMGRKIYVDTSSLGTYQAARSFYEKCGYLVAAVFNDFFRPGDNKVVYVKDLPVGGSKDACQDLLAGGGLLI